MDGIRFVILRPPMDGIRLVILRPPMEGIRFVILRPRLAAEESPIRDASLRSA